MPSTQNPVRRNHLQLHPRQHNAGGGGSFTPANDFVGTINTPYTIDVGKGGTDTATITVTVFDNPPEAMPDVNTALKDVPATGNVLTNDAEPNPNDDIAVSQDNGVALNPAGNAITGGTLIVVSNGDYTFTPTAGFVGSATFTYTVADENGNDDTATVTIEVTDVPSPVDPADPDSPLNTAPVALNDTESTFVGNLVSGDATANDSDPDGEPIATTIVWEVLSSPRLGKANTDRAIIDTAPANIETIGLRFDALRADGTTLEYRVDINTLTGEIPSQGGAKRNYGPPFFQALENTRAQSQLQQQQANTLTGGSQ